jgi:hypothetical protein
MKMTCSRVAGNSIDGLETAISDPPEKASYQSFPDAYIIAPVFASTHLCGLPEICQTW